MMWTQGLVLVLADRFFACGYHLATLFEWIIKRSIATLHCVTYLMVMFL